MSTPRYVPITQGFNDDPETWELTDKFGDRSIRLWIEILRIMEETGNQWRQVDGWSASLSRKVRQSPANVQRIVGWMLAKGWLIAGQPLADGPPTILAARNYPKFHERRHAKKINMVAEQGSPLPILSDPSDPSKKENLKRKKAYPEGFQVSEEVRTWAKAKGLPDPAIHLEAFRDHHVSHRSTFSDWDAALRTWMRNVARFGGNGRRPEPDRPRRVPPLVKPGPIAEELSTEERAKVKALLSDLSKKLSA